MDILRARSMHQFVERNLNDFDFGVTNPRDALLKIDKHSRFYCQKGGCNWGHARAIFSKLPSLISYFGFYPKSGLQPPSLRF
jgi:hypothetical protein